MYASELKKKKSITDSPETFKSFCNERIQTFALSKLIT